MDSKKLINFSEVSVVLTGNKNTIRANRNNIQYSSEIEELVLFLDGWVSRNSVSKKATVDVKTTK